MSLGEKLLQLRKKEGFSQEEVAEKLDVSRQTVSKWETNQTVPELIKAKLLSELYNVSYDYLMNESKTDSDFANMEDMSDSIDWTAAWSKKYPILASYSKINGISTYNGEMSKLYDKMKNEFKMSDQDTVLILKDILYHKYLKAKTK